MVLLSRSTRATETPVEGEDATWYLLLYLNKPKKGERALSVLTLPPVIGPGNSGQGERQKENSGPEMSVCATLTVPKLWL